MDTRDLRDRYLVARLFTRHRDQLRPQPFESENARWLELVVALLMQAGDAPEEQAREAANMLAALDLLLAPACAAFAPDDPRAALIELVLRDHGFTAEGAATGRQAIIEVAQTLQERWDGKVQRYLRAWGERMLADLPEAFGIQALPQEAVRTAFTWWLQAALGLPVVMAHPELHDYAQAQGTTLAALVAAADSLDLNVALLDEAVALEMAAPPAEEG
ncbi:MAG: hypothetical protein GX601_08295 [Anaerolineales bacterium]|nr:hypothetical protein [Anaerolineales bacterium]